MTIKGTCRFDPQGAACVEGHDLKRRKINSELPAAACKGKQTGDFYDNEKHLVSESLWRMTAPSPPAIKPSMKRSQDIRVCVASDIDSDYFDAELYVSRGDGKSENIATLVQTKTGYKLIKDPYCNVRQEDLQRALTQAEEHLESMRPPAGRTGGHCAS